MRGDEASGRQKEKPQKKNKSSQTKPKHIKNRPKKIKPTTEQKKFVWHVLAPCFRYTFNAILTHANDRAQPNCPPLFQVQVAKCQESGKYFCLSGTHTNKKKQGVAQWKVCH